MFLFSYLIFLVLVEISFDVVVVFLVGYHAGDTLEVGNLQGIGLLLLVFEVCEDFLVGWGFVLLLMLALLLLVLGLFRLALLNLLHSDILEDLKASAEEVGQHGNIDDLITYKFIDVLTAFKLSLVQHFTVFIVLDGCQITLKFISLSDDALKHVSNIDFLEILGVEHPVFCDQLI